MDDSSSPPSAAAPAAARAPAWTIRPAARYAFCCTLWWWLGASAASVTAWLALEPATRLLGEAGLPDLRTEIVWASLGLVALLVLIGAWKFIAIRSTSYELEAGQLRTVSGVLSRETEHLELYRVRDIGERRPFLLRLIGLGEVILHSEDRSQPVQRLRGLPRSRQLAQDIRDQVEASRGRRGFVGLE